MNYLKKPQNCLYCNKELIGRADKKFCDKYCKSAYHYQKSRVESPNFFSQVDQQLRLNRRILKAYCKAGEFIVQTKTLFSEGFDPQFFTHKREDNDGRVFSFVYEFGFNVQNEQLFLTQW
ncbi:hypothetical protein BKI52_26910 [marine bacterium AO1-C]|nr:hypothetical protein BKI52_26910 [marine bacterium AO1-C]